MSQLSARVAGDRREWGASRSTTFSGLEVLWLSVVLGVPAVLFAWLAGVVGGLVAAVVALVGYVAATVWWLTRQGRGLLETTEARPLVEDEAPRLFNLGRGIAADLGMDPPRMSLVKEGGANALACFARGPVIGVTQGLLDDYTRTELEAVVTHCTVRLATRDLRRAALGAALGGAAGPAGVSRPTDADTRTAEITRYPPALASAIEKATPARGRRAAFWFVASGAGQVAQAERAEGLRDL